MSSSGIDKRDKAYKRMWFHGDYEDAKIRRARQFKRRDNEICREVEEMQYERDFAAGMFAD